MDKFLSWITQITDLSIFGLQAGPFAKSLSGIVVLLVLLGLISRRVRSFLPWAEIKVWLSRNVYTGSHPRTIQRISRQSILTPSAKISVATIYCLSAGYLLELYSIGAFVFVILTCMGNGVGVVTTVLSLLGIFLAAGIALVDAGRRRLVVIHHRRPSGYRHLQHFAAILLAIAMIGLLCSVVLSW